MTGTDLKVFRETKNLTQSQFAQLVGLKREKTISDYERGDQPVPDWLGKVVELLKESKNEIHLVDNGMTEPNELIRYLQQHLIIEREGTSPQQISEWDITLIENHKGNWEVGFADVPEVSVLLCLFSFFETIQSWDGLSKLIFNHGTSGEKTFEYVAGCLRKDFGENMGTIIQIAASEARNSKLLRK